MLLDLAPLPQAAAELPRAAGGAPTIPAASNWLSNIIPTNPIKAAADSAMVPLVIFALLFGLGASGIEEPERVALERMFRGVVLTMLRIVNWVLWLAPIGVFALAFGVGVVLGGSAAGVLAQYLLGVIGAALSSIALSYAAATVFGRIGLIAFARAALPSQVIAVSTQSSLASLPAMVDAAVGLPAQVSFFAIIAPVCLAMGVPVVLLPLLLAIETLPDIFRTLGNVTADLAVARISDETMCSAFSMM